MMRFLKALRADTQGVTIVEFALVAPVMLLFIGGILEIGYVTFARSTLESSILAAARASRVTECPNENAEELAEQLTKRMSVIMSADGAPPTLSVQSYGQKFGDVGNPEPFDDTDGNGTHSVGESYTDVNGNGEWDADMGQDGHYGTFGEVVEFKASFNVPSLFPWIAQRINSGQNFYTIESVTVIRNEPYEDASCSIT
ncbi:MAG: TadE/TadG family type IV pilus assembly protein [Erythrobacter sp.]